MARPPADDDAAPPGIDVAAMRARLQEALRALDALSQGSADSRGPVAPDQQSVGRLSRMDALQFQAMAQATERRRQAERQRIAAALARIEAGEYGWCVACGDPIPPRRLELDPAAPACVRCAERSRGAGPALSARGGD